MCESDLANKGLRYPCGFISVPDPNLIKIAKSVDKAIVERIGKELKSPKRQWKRRIYELVKLRTELLRWRAEKWVREIIGLMKVEWERRWEETELVYVVFNLDTKKRYVGETGQKVLQRWTEHMTDGRRNAYRRVYAYMNKIGMEKWLILPLEVVKGGKRARLLKENMQMIRWERHLINDKSTWYQGITAFNRRVMRQKGRVPPDNVEKKSEARRTLWKYKEEEAWSGLQEEEVWELVDIERKWPLPKKFSKEFQDRVSKKLRDFGHTVRTEYTLKLVSGEYDTRIVKRATMDCVEASRGANWRRLINDRTRVVKSPVETIANVVRRQMQIHKKEKSVECRCGEWTGMEKIEGHVRVKAQDIGDEHKELRTILCTDNKTPTKLVKGAYVFEQYRRATEFLNNMAFSAPNKALHTAIKEGKRDDLCKLSKGDIRRVLKRYDNGSLVVYERDKNAATWVVECASTYKKEWEDQFNPKKSPQYETVAHTETQTKERIERAYNKIQISKTIKGRRRWRLGCSRILPKDKDIRKRRPIISFAGAHGARLGKIIARALEVLIKWISKKWRTMNLNRVSELHENIKRTTKERTWKKVINEQKMTFIKMDIKNMFTALNKKDVKTSLRKAIAKFEEGKHTHVKVHKTRAYKKLDGIGKGAVDKYWNVSTKDIREYALYELDNCYFKQGINIYKQTEGLPMGGNISAELAQLDCMRKEYENYGAWRRSGEKARWWRYRDDIFAMMKWNKSKKQVNEIVERLTKMYGGGMTVELEDWSYDKINILDITVTRYDKEIVITDYNKNIDFDDIEKTMDRRRWKTRYPDPNGGVDRRTAVSIMTAAMLQTHRRSSKHGEEYRKDIVKHAIEWKMMGYNKKMILTATSIHDPDLRELVAAAMAAF